MTSACNVAEYFEKSHLTAPSAVHLTTCFLPDSQHHRFSVKASLPLSPLQRFEVSNLVLLYSGLPILSICLRRLLQIVHTLLCEVLNQGFYTLLQFSNSFPDTICLVTDILPASSALVRPNSRLAWTIFTPVSTIGIPYHSFYPQHISEYCFTQAIPAHPCNTACCACCEIPCRITNISLLLPVGVSQNYLLWKISENVHEPISISDPWESAQKLKTL